jgi:hypothetical protein
MIETWKSVPGYADLYEVSDHGNVRSLRSGKPLKQQPDSDGKHLRVKLCRDGHKMTCRVHKLVLEAFVGPAPDGTESCHRDGNGENNALTNLRWGTRSGNMQDKVNHGMHHNASKTRCDSGHELTEENTRTVLTPEGWTKRTCRTCARNRTRSYRDRKRGISS